MNARAKLDRVPEDRVAADFLAEKFGIEVHGQRSETFVGRLLRRLGEHLSLVAISLAAAIVVSIPLGRHRGAAAPARTVHPDDHRADPDDPLAGASGVHDPLAGDRGQAGPGRRSFSTACCRSSATRPRACATSRPRCANRPRPWACPPRARLLRIELPMAARSILAGIKTAAVINVGTATIGALIGAGGFGQPILTGIRRDDLSMILFEGAIPAALLALAVQGAFDLAERFARSPAGSARA